MPENTPNLVRSQQFEFVHATCSVGVANRFAWMHDENLADKKTAAYKCEGCGEVLIVVMPKSTRRLRGRLVERRRKEVEHIGAS